MSNTKAATGKHTQHASFQVTDPDNDGDVEMTSHQEAHASTQTNIVVNSQAVSAHSSAGTAGEGRQRQRANLLCESGTSANGPPVSPLTSESELLDVVSDLSDDGAPELATEVSPTLNIAAFFKKPGKRGPKGGLKLFRKCRVCVSEKYIVNEVTTLCRHLQASHRKHYNKWCEHHNFQLKLPKNVKAHKDAQQEAAAAQTTLNGHLQPIDHLTPVLKYSDALFQEAAEDWMILTNQPLDALSHPHFHHMIDVASSATDGVKIPERCLAHIINLATQAVIAAYSSTAHINVDSSTADVDKTQSDLANIAICFIRDEVGLVRLLAVKARSSAKQTELLKQLQSKEGVWVPLTLILDMKVRWSFTFAMLQRAYDLLEFFNDFVYKISQEEPTAEKQRELLELRVSEDEWNRVKEFLKVLKHANTAQHTFSTETNPSLCHALPALKRLHKMWTAFANKEKYASFHDALNAGLSKVSTYYNKTSAVDAYTMTMILSPALKTSYFQKQWGEELELSTRTQCEKLYFEEWWKCLNPPKSANPSTHPLAPSTSKTLLDIDLSDDEDSASPSPLSTLTPTSTSTVEKPWLKEFIKYLDGEDELEAGQSVVAWWGAHAHRLPTWASLAQDYLAIMASSVSSERAFSAAGITISKCRNSLKADIVEALQVLKSLINSDLIFCEPDVTTDWEFENEVEEDDGDSTWVDVAVSDNKDIVL
ncbi:hypothetical protein EST38_g9925 [Candolleomyces aberdarensis]|uniref:HAT C-terminal dimerisation domain-containing protein n=1 Tax=Candolleomyces aberdarensis TaxID=2316362 RepID=A0A4Q2DAG0_9AGAR|nr:hypothetical protein EST38_g9925 [Candolleomyces aberdarensis]